MEWQKLLSGAPSEFDWYDAWLLAALLLASEGCSPVPLWRVIAAGDGLNKAILSRDEIELALGRLWHAGYTQVGPDGFAPTEAARALNVKESMIDVDSVARAIGAKPWSAALPMPRTPDETYVSRDAYEGAVKRYNQWFWQKYRSSASRDE